MKRRSFIKMGSMPLLMNGLNLRTFASSSILQMFACEGVADRALVIIQMSGGNDGVNTTVPLDQYDLYANLRPKLKLPSNKLLKLQTGLATNQQIGLHPAMTGMKDLYDQGMLNVVQGVSYNQPNLSHFKSTDLWLTGGDSTPALFNLTSGWMGRYLESTFPGKIGNPTDELPDPLGIQIGDDRPSVGYLTPLDVSAAVNLGWNDPAGYYNQVLEIGGIPPSSFPPGDYGTELEYLVRVQNNVSAYANRISSVFNAGQNIVNYPDNGLAYQLKTVARMISGGSKTKIFLVNTYGYDTHNAQVEESDTTIGDHAELLGELSASIKAFVDDLKALQKDQQVLTVTFSEFGRKPAENANMGTDHGTIAPMFVIGSPVQGGVTGKNVNFSAIEDELFTEVQIDYRQVFTTVLQDWLGASEAILTNTLFNNFISQKLPLINSISKVDPSCFGAAPLPIKLVQFEAQVVNEKWVELDWIVAIETANSRYEVQRSKDGKEFSSILFQKSMDDDTTGNKMYTDYDKNPRSGKSYYRLKMVDNEGVISYSEIKKINIISKEEKSFKIYPNPAIFDVNVVLNSKFNRNSQVYLIDQAGRVVINKNWILNEGFNKLNLDISSLPGGNYFIRFVDEDNIKVVAPMTIIRP
ncbi:MAG: DUF1501 domain-containing protein [Saprospiraceae bacterium]|nr:DUF1501 domain-containing protein [Saprospiraceae bacterium]MBK9679371.1 DUF1501 domain-containing protein [Saprospiraceae bacterium]MBP7923133.1 DUF1501 domain-containing protein [Saprospiraceae bacterium]MBP9744310.1 DUF1501 domain-containing protein [Saprospiraceae bacterium]